MASPYHFKTTGGRRVVTCDFCAAGTDTLWDFSDAHDSTLCMNHLHIHSVNVSACATIGFRILDNSSDGNRVVSMPASDVSGVAVQRWAFNPPIDITVSEYTRLCADTTAANQARVTIVYDWGA